MKNRRNRTGSLLTFSAMMVIAGCAETPNKVERFGSVIGLKKEKIDEYKRLHADTWPGVLRKIDECNIRNYVIYLTEIEPDTFYLFSHFEYVGDDFEGDMNKMKEDPTTRKWWKLTDPCQIPLPNRKDDESWKRMEEVFYTP